MPMPGLTPTPRRRLVRLDQAQRRLEAWVANLDDEPEERPLGVVRGVYEDACHAMADGFTKALVARMDGLGVLHQTRIYSEIVSDRPKPVAYFLVDAMRFEMGVELAERLPKSVEVAYAPPSARCPASRRLVWPRCCRVHRPASVLSSRAERSAPGSTTHFLPDLAARKKFAASRVPKLVDITLDELLGLQPSRLAKKIDGAQVIIVRSQEIDHAGENGFTFQARQVMDTSSTISHERFASSPRRASSTRADRRSWPSVFPFRPRRVDADRRAGRRRDRSSSPLLDWSWRRNPAWLRSRRCVGARV